MWVFEYSGIAPRVHLFVFLVFMYILNLAICDIIYSALHTQVSDHYVTLSSSYFSHE